MKILVTGGAGFVGSYIVDELQHRGMEPWTFDHHATSHNSIAGDIRDVALLTEAMEDCTAVYHCAAIADLDDARGNPRLAAEVNIMGTVSVLEAMKASRTSRLLYASSIYVHSNQGSIYRATKKAAEDLVLDLSALWGFRSTILRFGSLYGPRADTRNAITRLVRQAVYEGRIDYWGDGSEIREYVHAADAASLAVDAIDDSFTDEILHITGQERLSSRELLEMIKEMLGGELILTFRDEPFEGRYRQTPYALGRRAGKRFTGNTSTDLGLGILDLMQAEHDRRMMIET